MDVDLDALLSPRVRSRIEELGIRLTTYSGLGADGAPLPADAPIRP
jgi:hypothetical protein